jgi:hypothetical protein
VKKNRKAVIKIALAGENGVTCLFQQQQQLFSVSQNCAFQECCRAFSLTLSKTELLRNLSNASGDRYVIYELLMILNDPCDELHTIRANTYPHITIQMLL